jgi:hypothetical protein
MLTRSPLTRFENPAPLRVRQEKLPAPREGQRAATKSGAACKLSCGMMHDDEAAALRRRVQVGGVLGRSRARGIGGNRQTKNRRGCQGPTPK